MPDEKSSVGEPHPATWVASQFASVPPTLRIISETATSGNRASTQERFIRISAGRCRRDDAVPDNDLDKPAQIE